MKRKYAQFAAAGLGYAIDGYPGAHFGYRAAGQMYDYMYPNPKRILLTKKNPSMSFYKGSMLSRRPRMSFKDIALQKGFHVTRENYGKVADPHCVYINHSTSCVEEIAKCLVGMWIRTLFRKAGIAINTNKDEILGTTETNSSGWNIIYETFDRTTQVVGSTNYVTLDNQGLQDIVNAWVTMRASLVGALNGVTEAQPYKITLYHNDTPGHAAAQMDLQTTYMRLNLSSTLKFQNQTRGTNSADDDIEKVDNQPLLVKAFEHRHADPRLSRTSQSLGLEVNNLDRAGREGLVTFRAAQFPDNEFQNIPSAKIWNNVIRTGTIVLNPGVMKSNNIYFAVKGYCSNVVNYLRANISTGHQTGGVGKCVTLVFEEKLRTASSNNVTVSFEQNYQAGGYCTFDKPAALTSKFSINEINNVPA